MKFTTKSLPLEIKAIDSEAGTFEGVVACFNSIDSYGDIFQPGCFAEDLEFFKSYGVSRDEHSVTTGKVLDAQEVPAGLWFKVKVSDTAAGREQMTLLRDGVYKFLSIGSKNTAHWIDGLEAVLDYWKERDYQPSDEELGRAANGARIITRAKAYEGSTTFCPANENTRITSVKSDAPAGVSFRVQLRAALETVEEIAERAEAIKALREADGRDLGPEAKALLGSLKDQLARIDGLVTEKAAAVETPTANAESDEQPAASEPEGKSDDLDITPPFLSDAELESAFLATCAALNGVSL